MPWPPRYEGAGELPTLGNSTGGVQKGKFINSLSQKSEIFDSSLKTREPRALPRRNHHPTARKYQFITN